MPKRFIYIDCLRGAAMLMVVYSHITSFSMGHIQLSPVGQFMQDIMLPLFFFISGFCAYKQNREWNMKTFGQQLFGKVRTILIPTIVMFTSFMLYSGNEISSVILRYDKGGYWFTWILFQILIVYILFDVVCSKFQNRWVKVLVTLSPLVLFNVIFRFVGYESQTAVFFEWIKVVGYYFFFLAGVFTRWFQPKLNTLLSNRYANAILPIGALSTYSLWGGEKNIIIQRIANILYILLP